MYKKGLVGIPEPKASRSSDNIFDGLLSRISCIKDNDYVLIYIVGSKQLKGIYKADGAPFYDTKQVWNDRIYPFRCRIKISEYCFENPLMLNDINDLRNNNKIWTWALQRASGSNAMFAISDYEFDILINEYIKINPFSRYKWIIAEPYPYHEFNLLEQIHKNNNEPKYEYSVMTHLNYSFSNGYFKNIFGNYTDHLCYVPTNLGREMDLLLMYGNPKDEKVILSYDIIEVKRDEFDSDALSQLIDYESWFLQKKIAGDMKMLRTTAIAKRFSNDVIDYVSKREKYENKPIKLVRYFVDENGKFNMEKIN